MKGLPAWIMTVREAEPDAPPICPSSLHALAIQGRQ